MSTRRTIRFGDRWHLFFDVVAEAYYLDFGLRKGDYQRAYQIWPPTLKRLY